MFARYALPSDDVAGDATVTSPFEESAYGAPFLVATSTTGHLNLPSRPAKLNTTSGYWNLDFASPVTLYGYAIIYHNFDVGLDVTLELGGGSPFSNVIQVPTSAAHHEDDWPPNIWEEFDNPISGVEAVQLSINEANSINPQVGRLLLLTAIRDIGNDVRWGVSEGEEHTFIGLRTELGIETIYDLGGKQRSATAEIALEDADHSNLISLYRNARTRVQPWLLIPDVDETDCWLVRFEENRNRIRETINHNVFPFRVKEVARGLPWP
jgi:hypothetical protein